MTTTKSGNRHIHVVHLIGSTGLYGAERWVLALMRAMQADAIRSMLINLVDDCGERSAVVAAANQRVLDASDFATSGKFNPLSALRLARWIREKKVDIVHGHGFKSDVIGFLAARMAGCKVMTTPHGWSLEKDRKLQMYENLDRAMFRFMDMVCPLSSDLAEGLTSWVPAGKVRLITNGVDLDDVRSAIPIQKQSPDGFLIGYVGQLIERKDLSTLLQALKLLLDGGSKVRLLVVGDGPKQTALRDEAHQLNITKYVEFMGFRTDAAGFLKTFDVFVLPSLLEGIPRCVMEAMAVGVPVVASDIPGNRNLVIHGETGLLFTPGDSHDLSENIKYLMNHPGESRTIALRGTRKVEEEFSSRKMAKEYAALYYELLGR